jgi:hypothetical protein
MQRVLLAGRKQGVSRNPTDTLRQKNARQYNLPQRRVHRRTKGEGMHSENSWKLDWLVGYAAPIRLASDIEKDMHPPKVSDLAADCFQQRWPPIGRVAKASIGFLSCST